MQEKAGIELVDVSDESIVGRFYSLDAAMEGIHNFKQLCNIGFTSTKKTKNFGNAGTLYNPYFTHP